MSIPEPDPGAFDTLQAIEGSTRRILAALGKTQAGLAEQLKLAMDSPEQAQTNALLTDLNKRLTDFDGLAKILNALRNDAAKGRSQQGKFTSLGKMAISFMVGTLIGAGMLYGAATIIHIPGSKQPVDPSGGWSRKIWTDNEVSLSDCVTRAAQIKKAVSCPIAVRP